jgi:transposase
MAMRRLSMRKIIEVLRLKSDHQMSNRQIAKSCSLSHSTVRDYLDRVRLGGLSWPLDPALDNATLEGMLFPHNAPLLSADRGMPPMDYLLKELRRKGVTLQLLWYEYKQTNPEGYQYSQFCHRYRQWVSKLDVALRQEHRAGEKLFVDYAGQTVPIIDLATGEEIQAQIFIAALGCSSYTFAKASLAQDLPSWIRSHVHAFEFHGVPEIWFRTTSSRGSPTLADMNPISTPPTRILHSTTGPP